MNRQHAQRSTTDIDDGWTLSPEIEALLVAPAVAVAKKPNVATKIDLDKIDLNKATAEELCGLPGIGRSRAKQIVSFRSEHGPFETPAALLAINGIGARTLEALASRLA